ncbi:MAG: hypothetical protein DVB23_001461 [Verrucomicrobia bacterium]|nr:MAG: hypothetical protein DVB23_001461 [Verrucomicrobiota bacterium]
MIVAVALPAWMCRNFDETEDLVGAEKGYDVRGTIGRLEQAKPQWVLIGNSMLYTRLTEGKLTEVSGVKSSLLARGRSQSAMWLLFLKNVLLQSKARPAVVTIFFRDTDLTWPDFRVTGGNERAIADLRGPEQPEWVQVLGRKDQSKGEPLHGLPNQASGFLRWLFPTDRLRAAAQRQIQERAFRATRVGTRANSSVRRAELNDRFSLSHLRSDLGSDAAPIRVGWEMAKVGAETIDMGFYEDGPVRFDSSPGASFLPHLVALAKQHQLQLHFHRIKRRPAANHSRPDGQVMTAYMTELSAYLREQGCLFTDESGDPALTLDMYVDGDHLSSKEDVQARYHRLFWERVRPQLAPHFNSAGGNRH